MSKISIYRFDIDIESHRICRLNIDFFDRPRAKLLFLRTDIISRHYTGNKKIIQLRHGSNRLINPLPVSITISVMRHACLFANHTQYLPLNKMFKYYNRGPTSRQWCYLTRYLTRLGCSGFVITRQSSHRLQCRSSSCSSQWGYADQEFMKKPILLTRIMSRCRLKALTEQASTVSCVRLFQRFSTRCENGWHLLQHNFFKYLFKIFILT